MPSGRVKCERAFVSVTDRRFQHFHQPSLGVFRDVRDIQDAAFLAACLNQSPIADRQNQPILVFSRSLMKHCMDTRLSSVELEAFIDSLRTAIHADVASGNVTIDRYAKQFEISRRTMQRRLRQAGLTFTSLVNQILLETATQWLADERRTVGEIAAELGYANSANFAKAFQRLSGVTPTEFRSRLKM
jgi:AraC-like DNA-binding protein